ncbi:uncharacterized protein [Diadema antillarum]|uniref:uncharacterized protein n=1 Tax=Diadema antillarum TaxID=105358 RepID=UPI003A88394D
MESRNLLNGIMFMLHMRKMRNEKRRRKTLQRRIRRRRCFTRAQSIERMHFVCMLSAAIIIGLGFTVPPQVHLRERGAWSLPKSDHWWRVVVCQTFTEDDWMANFRMSKQTFNYLCQKLRPSIQKMDTRLRSAIGVEQRVAITVWRLATNVEYRTIGQLFGVGTATVCKIVHQVCEAIRDTLAASMIRIPRGDAAADVVREFEVKWGFPQCFGAIDGSHIPVQSPKEFRADYYNRKGFYSIVLQGLVDHRYRFMNVNFGYPGSVHDARVFANSSVFQLGNDGELCPNIQREINGVDVEPVILGDSAYPLLPWLMKPFPDNGQLSREQRQYNYRQSRARMVVENAFGRLKGRWRILLKRNDTHIAFLGNLVLACVVLHNLCESAGEDFDEQLLAGVDAVAGHGPAGHDDLVGGNAVDIRNAFMHHLTEA